MPDCVDNLLYNDSLPGRDNLIFLLSVGVAASSHYSGCAGDLAWVPRFLDFMRFAGLLNESSPGIVLVDACDQEEHCQRCLVAFKPHFKHVFGRMQDRVPEDLWDLIEEVGPKAAGDAQHYKCQYDAVDALLKEASAQDELFCNGSTAPCASCMAEIALCTG